MKFRFRHVSGCYYIILCCNHYTYSLDKAIVVILQKYISITLEEYTEILTSCGATMIEYEYYFKDKRNVDKAIDILNEKYITLVKLLGG